MTRPTRSATSGAALLVTRACYLALRRAVATPWRPDGVVLVAEPGRALHGPDIERAVGVPVVATISHDPAVARAVDAGLLAARLPRMLAARAAGGGVTAVDERLVDALCRAAERDDGDADAVVRGHVRTARAARHRRRQ